MIFWSAAALLAAAAVALLLLPLSRRREPPADAASYDLAVYRDQLAELERDQARGVVSAAQAEAARAEIGRRMLAATDRKAAPRRAGATAARIAAAALTVIVPVGALTIYLPHGSPDLTGAVPQMAAGDERRALQAMTAEIGALRQRVETAPDDLDAWLRLGQLMSMMGRPAEAVDAYARATGLAGGDPEVTGAYGEALVEAGSGIVTAEARQAFEQVLDAAPGDPRARYYLALERYQAGDLQGAVDRWGDLRGDTPADAPWLALLDRRIEEAAGQMGRSVAELDLPEPLPAAAGPTAADMAAAGDMTAEERTAMVRGMVEGLAARLEESPDDLDGWLRLARAYSVMGERTKAAEAMSRAATLAPKDPQVLSAYADSLLAAAGGGNLPEGFMPVIERLYAADPDNVRALWFMGAKAVAEGRRDEARTLWQKALDQMEPGSEEHRIVAERLQALGSPTAP